MSNSTRTKLRFESLEPKRPLAGDVLVTITGGQLLIEGDAEANNIAITAGSEAGSLVIQGLDGTTIQLEGSDEPVPDTGLVVDEIRNVRVSLGDGDDVVSVSGIDVRKNLTIATGDGADEVTIGAGDGDSPVTVGGSLTVLTGDDDDQVTVAAAEVRGAVSVATDGGDDTVVLGLNAGATPASAVDAALSARFGVHVALGDGADSVSMNSVTTRGALAVSGGDGADSVTIANAEALLLGIQGGRDDGIDTVSLSGLDVDYAGIDLGRGDDQANVTDSVFHSLAVALGDGDDTLSTSTVTARRALLSAGGGENDELIDAGDNAIDRLVVSGFETPADVNTSNSSGRGGRFAQLIGKGGRFFGRPGR